MLRPLLLLALLSGLSLASPQHNGVFQAKARRHHERASALQERGNLTERQGQTFSGRATWFIVGLGACGQYSQPSDFMVALNTPQYTQNGDGYPGPECFKSITISYNGNTQVATILDECPSCNWGDLDMSQGLFDSFATPDTGEFQMTWWYNDDSSGGSGGGQPTTSSPAWSDPAPWTTDQPTSTSTPWSDPAPWTTDQPTSTSTPWSDPAPWTTDTPTSTSTSSTPTPTSTTSSSSSTSSSTSSSGSISLAGTPSTLSVAGSTPTAGAGTQNDPSVDNLGAIGQLVVNLGAIVVAGGNA